MARVSIGADMCPACGYIPIYSHHVTYKPAVAPRWWRKGVAATVQVTCLQCGYKWREVARHELANLMARGAG